MVCAQQLDGDRQMRVVTGEYGERRQYDDNGELYSINGMAPSCWTKPSLERQMYNKYGWILAVAVFVVGPIVSAMLSSWLFGVETKGSVCAPFFIGYDFSSGSPDSCLSPSLPRLLNASMVPIGLPFNVKLSMCNGSTTINVSRWSLL